jgi:homogentisate 1,2-dioxygenase
MTHHALPAGMVRAVTNKGVHEGYMPGFANDFETEALAGALPEGQNSPQKCSYGLYAEQLSGSAFTKPHPERTWCYRIRPSVKHTTRFEKIDVPLWKSAPHIIPDVTSLGQYRWDPVPHAQKPLTWVTGMRTVTTAGDVNTQTGMASHIYLVTASMEDEYFYSADGELLIVPQEGRLRFCTELGIIDLEPKEIAVLPRGMKFRLELVSGAARGYLCENYGQPFRLPELGPIGSQGLAQQADFQSPVAAFEDAGKCEVLAKFMGALWASEFDHSPLDVVAWRGDYVPYKYELARFMAINTVSFDHPDPSIFTVLTSPSAQSGVANCDFVIFPPRWVVAEDTFRPPWFHRNVMSELMGLVHGVYDAKAEGFLPGGVSIHNCMSAHGPDVATFEKAAREELKPRKIENTLAFMWESRYVWRPTKFAVVARELQ